jgi:hypothetical protein
MIGSGKRVNRRGRPDEERLGRIVEALREKPGLKVSQIAAAVGCDYQAVWLALTQLERRGLLLAEDDHGGLALAEWLDVSGVVANE